eukprot:NODE_139_length_1410_cov_293.337987_g109_i0.p1 GENE.NODE_139_length_1410_cov_293.337987_g109_i0~~NODE_139_length_1410_cov_293.337987_g109_i0.p1  ORF type:complete len:381 (+),score=71.93 NODE_139_length_1410_cov_293.337987_g109_i0:99-1241(+)
MMQGRMQSQQASGMYKLVMTSPPRAVEEEPLAESPSSLSNWADAVFNECGSEEGLVSDFDTDDTDTSRSITPPPCLPFDLPHDLEPPVPAFRHCAYDTNPVPPFYNVSYPTAEPTSEYPSEYPPLPTYSPQAVEVPEVPKGPMNGCNTKRPYKYHPLSGASSKMKGNTDTLPPHSMFDQFRGVVELLVEDNANCKILADTITSYMFAGQPVMLETHSTDSINNGIKAVCIVRPIVQPYGIDVYSRTEWHQDKQGIMMLCFPGRMDGELEAMDEELNIRVAGKTAPPPLMTAGLIANRLRSRHLCFLLTMGGEAVLQAMRSLCVTHNFLDTNGPVWFRPKFVTLYRRDGNRSAIQMMTNQNQPVPLASSQVVTGLAGSGSQ